MRCTRRAAMILALGGLLIMPGSLSAYTIMAGITLDIHQDVGMNRPDLWPNDFHIEGYICTRNNVMPILRQHKDGPFQSFNYTLTAVPGSEWFLFTADWWNPLGGPIPYCTVIHLGLLFDVQDENTIIHLVGWWTKNGQRVGGIIGGNDGYVPILGFSVAPIQGELAVRIGNGDVVPPPVVPPLPPIPPSPWPFPIEVTELDLMVWDQSALPPNWFEELRPGGLQENWPWVPVMNGSGMDVNPLNPVYVPPDSFFDIFLESMMPGQVRPMIPTPVLPNQLLMVRTKRLLTSNNSGVPDPVGGLWEWHIHEAQGPEACCFNDGSCAVLTPIDCAALNGFPQGPGTDCSDLNGDGKADICQQPQVAGPRFEFSLDIGSDTELSDPQMDGDEGFDPGDVYWWKSAPVTPPMVPGGADGFKDDLMIFGLDPNPNPPDPAIPPATRVPVGTGGPQSYAYYFDLDGHDQIDLSLRYEFNMHGLPLVAPIPRWNSPCIHDPHYLMISYDDDLAPGWPLGDVPINQPSPGGVSSYGTTAGKNEIIGITLAVLPMPPYPVLRTYGIADEVSVHQSLTPNPDAGDPQDDDADSLDVVPDPQEAGWLCPYWYFTADHEAHYGLDPGDIYEVSAGGIGGPLLVIDDVKNLGIPDSTDIDAFEFTWLPFETGGSFLAVLFSVDDDDPLTPGNESGGLDPRVIYASFMTGWYFPLTGPLADDVDALTIWKEELAPPCPAPTIIAAQSIKTHAGAGTFGIDLAVPTLPQVDAVESRVITVPNPMRILVTFSANVVAVDGVFNAGPGQEVQLSSNPPGVINVVGVIQPAPNQLEITLSAVPNASCLHVLLHNVACDNGGGVPGAVMPDVDLTQRILLCDSVGTGNGLVETNDVSFTKSKASLGTVDAGSFRTDYDTDGTVSNADVSRSKAMASLSQTQVTCP